MWFSWFCPPALVQCGCAHLFLSLSILYHLYLSSQGLCTKNTDINEYKYSVRNCTLCRTHCRQSSTRRRPNLPVQRASVRACVPVRGVVCPASGTVCAGGWGLHRRGIQRPPSPARSVALPPKKQKRPTPPSQNETHPIVQVSKNSEKYKKTPFGA